MKRQSTSKENCNYEKQKNVHPKNKISEIKNSMDWFNRTMGMAKERISELADGSTLKNKDNRNRNTQNSIKHKRLGKRSQICLKLETRR